MQLKKKHRYVLSILSGILMVISFPFTGSLTLVAFVAWIPLLIVESNIARNSYRPGKVYTHSLITFLIFNVGTTWWIWNASEVGSIMAFVVNTLLMSLVIYMFHLTKRYVGSKEGYISLLVYWLAFEYFHLDWEASWPWLTLGNTFSVTPAWIQWYSLTGVMGGSLWILSINLLLFRAFDNVYFKRETWNIQTPLFILASLFFIIPMTFSIVTYLTYEEKIDPVSIVVVQNNDDPYSTKFTRNVYESYDHIISLAERKISDSTELILAPETALTLYFNEEGFEHHPFYKYLVDRRNQAAEIPLHIGSFSHRDYDVKRSVASREKIGEPGFEEHYNSSLLIGAEGDLSITHKSKLVPGVERIPFSNTFPSLENIAVDLGGGSGTLGIEDHPKIFKTKHFSFAPVICYESVYGGFIAEQCRNGAEFIGIITNDGWWGDTPGYRQHQSFASIRAIENRRSVARSANTGSSCFVNQRGDILLATDWWVEEAISGTINKNDELTIYSQFGDYLGRSLSFVAVLLVLFTFVKRFLKYVRK